MAPVTNDLVVWLNLLIISVINIILTWLNGVALICKWLLIHVVLGVTDYEFVNSGSLICYELIGLYTVLFRSLS